MTIGLFVKFFLIAVIVSLAGNIIGRIFAQQAFRHALGVAIVYLILGVVLLVGGIYFAWRIDSAMGGFALALSIGTSALSYRKWSKPKY